MEFLRLQVLEQQHIIDDLSKVLQLLLLLLPLLQLLLILHQLLLVLYCNYFTSFTTPTITTTTTTNTTVHVKPMFSLAAWGIRVLWYKVETPQYFYIITLPGHRFHLSLINSAEHRHLIAEESRPYSCYTFFKIQTLAIYCISCNLKRDDFY